MENIKNIIEQVIGQISSKKEDSQEKIYRLWVSIVENEDLKHIKLIGIKNGFIYVNVDSPAWAYKMKIKKYQLLSRLKEVMEEVKDINFKIGSVL